MGTSNSHVSKEFVLESTRRDKKKTNKKLPPYVIIGLLVWVALVLGGIYAAKTYVDKTFLKQTEEVKKSNALLIETVSKEFQTVKEEMLALQKELSATQEELDSVRDELQQTGKTMAGSNSSKILLTDHVSELDRQIVELRKQLKKLEDAARVY